jgi:hypothetical protein
MSGFDLFKQRRFWAAVVPVVTMVAGAFGVPIADEVLTGTGDKVIVAFTSLLAAWSLFFPKTV